MPPKKIDKQGVQSEQDSLKMDELTQGIYEMYEQNPKGLLDYIRRYL